MSADDLLGTLQACTLPSTQRPLRVAEFDDLVATAVQAQERVSPTCLRWTLAASAQARARELAARETACCSFFTFTVSADPDADSCRVDVRVPPAQVAVLDALAARAQAGLAP